MRTTEQEIADRYYSRFGAEPDAAKLANIPGELNAALDLASTHQEEQDAFDAVLSWLDS